MSRATKDHPGRAAEGFDPPAVVMRYHRETKHHFRRYARSLGYMDWANQPDPFRRYAGAPLVPLPLLPSDDTRPRYADLYRTGAIASAPVNVRSISRFFEYSLAITAWKQAGEVRWALRANPSSGNLHPTEGYLLIGSVPGLLLSAGLYHYTAKEHALELRAEWSQESFTSLLQAFPPHAFLVGFTSVNWRETWKYGERAFRYCQHDVGHAIGGARIAAQTLGWRMLLLDGTADDTVAALLGVDRTEDFSGAEREHPDCLAVVWPADQGADSAARSTITVPLFLAMASIHDSRRPIWHGTANRLSRKDPVGWPLLHDVEVASWKSSTERRVVELGRGSADTNVRTGIYAGEPSAEQVIHQRRSALAFDGITSISVDSFFTMLARVMPRTERGIGQRPLPWDVLPWDPTVHLALFVHRVDGLATGLYMLARDPAKVDVLRTAMHRPFAWTSPPGCPRDLPLFLLDEGDARQLAAQVSCHQDIAGDGAFSLGMIAEFESSVRRYG
ncbi:MAG TPA: SagB family peptide dehydrogenase, partial [Burkholderiaceae bacterium]|nr:SagB family peptide dehydrogenase [Burkholderiaceae bacterium]